MKKTVLIIGAGYTGTVIGRHLGEAGHEVYGLTRSETRRPARQQARIRPVIADLLKPETLQALPQADWVVIAVSPENRDPVSYRRTYVEGTGHYLKSLAGKKGPEKILYLSSTGIFADAGGGWVDETTPVRATQERGKILWEAEKQLFDSGYPCFILRLAGIYGPGRNRVQSVAREDWQPPQQDAYMNVIHVEDVARAALILFERGAAGEIYLGCDGTPFKRSEFYGWLCRRLGKPAAGAAIGGPVLGKRCRNDKLLALGFEPKFRHFREGYESFFKEVPQ